MRRLLPDFLVVALLLAAAVTFRIPPLLNVNSVNSDTAVVGLQALHALRGEHQRVLWGTSYQGSLEVELVAVLLRVLPFDLATILAVSALLGHLALVVAFYVLARKRLTPALAGLCAALVVYCPDPLNFLTWSPPRIWAFALFVWAIAILDRALERQRVLATIAGGALVGVAYYSDLFLTLMLPGVMAFSVAKLWPHPDRRRSALLALLGTGAFFGGAFLCWSRQMQGPRAGELSLGHLQTAWNLFADECLPIALGFRVYLTPDGFGRVLLAPSVLLRVLSGLALLGMFGLLLGGLRRAWRDRLGAGPLVLLGVGWCGVAVVGFLSTGRAQDLMNARYLNPLVLSLPVLAAAALAGARRSRMALAAGAVIVSAHFATAGWRAYGPWVDGLTPVRDPVASGNDERRVLAELHARGVTFALADYWLAYRFMLLDGERLPIVPTYGDRYPSMRMGVFEEGMRAVIFMDGVPAQLAHWRARSDVTEISVGRYHAFVMTTGAMERGLYALTVEPAGTAELSAGPGQVVSLPLAVTNAGGLRLLDGPVQLGYHLAPTDGGTLLRDQGRAGLGGNLESGELRKLSLSIRAPTTPGRYAVQLDAVEEGVTWFSERKNPVQTVSLVVSAPGEPPTSATLEPSLPGP